MRGLEDHHDVRRTLSSAAREEVIAFDSTFPTSARVLKAAGAAAQRQLRSAAPAYDAEVTATTAINIAAACLRRPRYRRIGDQHWISGAPVARPVGPALETEHVGTKSMK
jgi:hypothetical protein